MKKFFIISGYVFAGVLLFVYASFLFVLPHAVNLNQYKPEIQNLVKENSGFDIDFGNLKLYTTPLLEVGVKTRNIMVKLPDESEALSIDKIRAKVFLPSLLWLQVYVPEVKIENPNLNAEIINDEQYKIVRVYEDFVNSKRKDKLEHPENYQVTEDKSSLPIDISKIKISIPNVKLNNYNVVVNDIQNGHKLTLKGEKLILGYNNGKTAKLKTNAQFLSDEDTNITANIDINTFLPKFAKSEAEEDDEAVFAVPFVNPVTTYRTYELKSNINSKLKIRKCKKSNKIKLNGFANVENTTLKMSDLQLPESYFKLKSRGTRSEIDTNLFVTEEEYIGLLGKIDYGKKPYLDLAFNSSQVHLQNLFNILRAYLDTIQVNNDFKDMSAEGYLFTDAKIKTDYKKLLSSGRFFVRKGNITNSNKGILFDKINASLFFDENQLLIKDTSVSINNRPLELSGKVDSDSFANLYIKGEKIPLMGLYNAFAPRNIKNQYLLTSGYLTIDSKISGQINKLVALLRSSLENVDFRAKNKEFIIKNNQLRFGFAAFERELHGRLYNSGFVAIFPKRHSVVKDNELKIDIEDDKITIKPTDVTFNENSAVNISGGLSDIFKEINAVININGKLSSNDLAEVLLHTAIPYFDIKGFLPIRAKLSMKGDNLKAIAQVSADSKNYITPVNMDDLLGKQTIFQLCAEKSKNSLKINNTGLYVKPGSAVLNENLAINARGAKELVKIRGIISNLNFQPFISLIKVNIPSELGGSVSILKKSRFKLGGNLHIFGKPENPKITGKIDLKKLSFPELLTTMNRVLIDLGSNRISARAHQIDANGNDFSIIAISDWDKIISLTFNEVKIFSKYIDVNTLLKVPEAGEKAFPGSAQSVRNDEGVRPDNPVKILNGSLRFNKIVIDNLYTNKTSSKLRMNKSTVYLNNLKTHPLGGKVAGDASYNILDTKISAKVSGEDFDIEKVLLDVMNMKDMVSGTANFIADITLKGTNINEQLKSLKGYLDFNIKNGQLGPFGKIENFLMAENIRENAFFSSTIGSVITNLVTFDTSRYNSLFGHLTFENGIVNISPIKSQGNVMSMFISGNAGLLDNSADLKVRVKLASAFSDKLGPLSNINPINIVKKTPGVNAVALKMFTLFCEAVSEEEMNAIPELGEGKSDENATKIQIKLRGDTRKPLKMIKSFKWLALDSDIQSAKDFVDTIPTPEAGEENLSVEELIQLRQQQAEEKAKIQAQEKAEQEAKKPINKIKNAIKKNKKSE